MSESNIDFDMVRRFVKDMLIHDGYHKTLVDNYLETPDIIEFLNLLIKEIERNPDKFPIKKLAPS